MKMSESLRQIVRATRLEIEAADRVNQAGNANSFQTGVPDVSWAEASNQRWSLRRHEPAQDQ
jgi:hypothetical protein